jgi:hypothetical protein
MGRQTFDVTSRLLAGRSERGLCPRNPGGRYRRGAKPPSEGIYMGRRRLQTLSI